MAIAILGKKIGMTQFFDDMGNRIPVTVVEAGPCQVLKVKTAEGADGYDAVVLGLGKARLKSLTRPERGVFAKWNVEAPEVVREIRVSPEEALLYSPGSAVDVSLFQVGERVDVTAKSRGRGFTGVMKRHGFHGFSRTHGVHEYQRHSGSIGCRTTPGRVQKGMRMAGRHGDHQFTILNQRVIAIYPTQNLLLIEGGVPGAPNSLVVIRKAVKVPIKKSA
ncbi:MAG TPA: 50S ribosomal protein L3 [Myxococcota bacterium]|nr:50S ribosomal protein L3 [Myxococcota bacterium]HQK52068.1 50S ribosomal protein L3 [Myxococcota bacterium]